MLAALGLFVFDMTTLPFAEIEERDEWRHSSTPRFRARPASQFLGIGQADLSIMGALVPEIAGSYSSIDLLKQMADTGEAYALVEGTGRVRGDYKILRLQQRKSELIDIGLPRKIDFAIDLMIVP
ncbi:phage tail protein [Sphingomonas sp. PR090111-T3T-6A]|uniref:phage tail protein n=1 Tax=Sphingomonas sp. PR090111-T3T-6A TaxID=685778 RepID=UPI000377D0AE|nr:phage tail protein [Sphingomonas sp. PR090111-T3T-6A]